MSLEHYMISKMKTVKIFFAVLIISMLFNTVYATSSNEKTAKISDYEYSGDEEKIIVANRNAEKCVALTFDDGPHPLYTKEILDILDRYNAKATFFVIGKNAQDNKELLLEELKRGHEIGNHTFTHPDLKIISNEKFREELIATDNIIKEITGEKPKLFRPPCGYISNSIVNTLSENDYSVVLWSWRQDTRDWARPGVNHIVSTVITNINDGDIILFHDYNSKKSQTPNALEIILSQLSEKGYKFVTVSELMNM